MKKIVLAFMIVLLTAFPALAKDKRANEYKYKIACGSPYLTFYTDAYEHKYTDKIFFVGYMPSRQVIIEVTVTEAACTVTQQ